MILQSLVRLAEQEDLLAEQNYEPKPVAWIVDIDQEGNILGIVSTRYRPEGSKSETVLTELIPRRRTGRTSKAVVPDYLVDNAKYCFGFSTPSVDTDHLRKIRESHQEDLEEIVKRNGDDGAKAQLACVRRIAEAPTEFSIKWCGQDKESEKIVGPVRPERRPRSRPQQKKLPEGVIDTEGRSIKVPSTWKSNDLFAFRLDGEWVCHRQGVKEYLDWKRQERKGAVALCLVCGREGTMIDLHPTVPLPGPTTKGVPLVSFNAGAFESYGLSGNENAPVCVTCAEAYTTALKRLLHRQGFPHPREASSTLPVGNVRLPSNTVVVFWSNEKQDVSMSFLAGLLEASPDAVAALYGSPWKGQQITVDDPTQFHTLVFTGVQGRAVVRTAEITTLGSVARNFRQHFDDLKIFLDRRERYNGLSIPSLLESIRPPGNKAYTPPHIVTFLFLSALKGQPYAQELLAGALRRIKAEAGQERKEEGISARRVALLKAWINRQHRFRPHPFPFKELTPDMDKENATPAYRLGRLFAVLEKVQDEATNAQAGIADRFLGAASTTPALVFGRLLKMHHHHLAKLSKGRSIQLGNLIDEILSPLPGTLKSTLSLAEQGVFMVGYHHQRADLWKKKDDGTGTNSDDQERN